MSTVNSFRKNCRDVFNAFLVRFAVYAGFYEFPVIAPNSYTPNRLVRFSRAISSKDYDQWVHFFEDDYQFERLWRNPRRYLPILRKFNGVISPDFSLYRDMPLVMQLWNIYRSRAICYWLQINGVKVVPNVRFGDSRTFKIVCDGLPKHSTIAIGTYGNLKDATDARIFIAGIKVIVDRLEPSTIVVFGSIQHPTFTEFRARKIRILQFDSDYAVSRKNVA